MTDVLGKLSFSDVPDIAGHDALLNFGATPGILADTTANQPVAGTNPVGTLFLDTSLNKFFRDDGAVWTDLTPLITLTSTSNQIFITQATTSFPAHIALADNTVLPGTGGFMPPSGNTIQRPAAPTAGVIRYNSSLGNHESYISGDWVPLGKVLQVVSGNINAASGTTTVPLDNTIPTNTEGWKIWTQSFTPVSASSRVIIDFTITTAASNNNANIICSVFNGTTNIGSTVARAPTANTPNNLTAHFVFQPGTSVPITLSARIGASAAATTYCNQISTATLGGALVSEFTITEVL